MLLGCLGVSEHERQHLDVVVGGTVVRDNNSSPGFLTVHDLDNCHRINQTVTVLPLPHHIEELCARRYTHNTGSNNNNTTIPWPIGVLQWDTSLERKPEARTRAGGRCSSLLFLAFFLHESFAHLIHDPLSLCFSPFSLSLSLFLAFCGGCVCVWMSAADTERTDRTTYKTMTESV